MTTSVSAEVDNRRLRRMIAYRRSCKAPCLAGRVLHTQAQRARFGERRGWSSGKLDWHAVRVTKLDMRDYFSNETWTTVVWLQNGRNTTKGSLCSSVCELFRRGAKSFLYACARVQHIPSLGMLESGGPREPHDYAVPRPAQCSWGL